MFYNTLTFDTYDQSDPARDPRYGNAFVLFNWPVYVLLRHRE